MKQYYECHITVEPVFEEKLLQFQEMCKEYNFKVARLLLQKREKDSPERSSKDSFCTGHSLDFEDMNIRMRSLSDKISNSGIKVWRRKIEHVIFDERMKDAA